MATVLTVSYENEHELQVVLKLVKPAFHHIKRHKNCIGKYKKADIWLKY